MTETATVRWRSARTGATTAVLTLDGLVARLVVTAEGPAPDTVGHYERELTELPSAAALPAASELVYDAEAVSNDPIRAAAETLAAAVREHPVATAKFVLAPGEPGTTRAVTLGVGNQAERPIAFTLDVSQCTVDFFAAGQAVGWQPFPSLPTGFVTSDAELLGGVRMRAAVGPGVVGAIVFDVAVPSAADEVRAHVAGSLYVGEEVPIAFFARTAAVALAGP